MAISLPWPFSYSNSDAELDDNKQDPPPLRDMSNSLFHLLHHYEVPGMRPPSARVDPSLKQRERAFRIWDVWKYGAVAAVKGKRTSRHVRRRRTLLTLFPATEVAFDLTSHSLFGPRKKSWGIEMTLITSFMRNVGKHSHLVDIVGLAPCAVSYVLTTPIRPPFDS
jgi:hypothetical protein